MGFYFLSANYAHQTGVTRAVRTHSLARYASQSVSASLSPLQALQTYDIIPRSNLVEHRTVERMQINCWVSGEAGERIKALAKAQNISYGQLLTALLLEQPIAVQDWQTAVSDLIQRVNEIEASLSSLQPLQDGNELRGLITGQDVRLNALEVAVMTPITTGGGKVRITLQPAKLASVETVETNDDASFHQADSLSLPSLSQDELETLVKETYKECGDKIGKTMAALREKGRGIGQDRLYKIVGRKAWDGSRG